MEFLKRVIGTKTFWTGLASLVGGCIFLAQGKTEVGAVMVTQGVGMIVGRDALVKLGDSIKGNGKSLLILLAFLPLATGCASFKAVTGGIGDLAKDTGQAIIEDVDWRKHLGDFFNDLGDLFFGEPETPETPSPEVSAPPSETSTVSI